MFLLKCPPTEPILTHPKCCLLQLLWPSFSCFISSISYSFSRVEAKFSSSVEFSRSKDSCPCDLLKEASQEKGGEGRTGQRKPAEPASVTSLGTSMRQKLRGGTLPGSPCSVGLLKDT